MKRGRVMKRSHLLTIVLLVFLMVAGWLNVLTADADAATNEQKLHMESADKYFDKGLFWKAGQEYLEALSNTGTEENWQIMLDAFASSYAQGDDCYTEYLSAAQAAVSAYRNNENFLMQLISLYTDDDNYAQALSILNQARNSGLESPAVLDKILEVSYAFELLWEDYDQIGSFTNGYISASSDGEYFYVDTTGSSERIRGISGLGPMGEDGIRTFVLEDKLTFQDEAGVPQGFVTGSIEEIGVYAEGLIPVKVNGSVSYYNLIGEKQFGSYERAGTFCLSRAAVCKDNKWYLVDSTGSLSDESFEDIVLNEDGTWTDNGIMLAKTGGKYRLYDTNLEPVCDGAWDAVDVVCKDSPIAFCVNGKWGYMDSEGTVLIEPAYTNAKSFSNGLAAVSNGSLWGFIDVNGNLVIDYQFQDADYFTEAGCCMVLTDTGWKMLSRYVTQ